jgi:serine/threonine protein phosphatase PrpC
VSTIDRCAQVVVVQGVVVGASSGDSECWIVRSNSHHVLTGDRRKWRVGSGRAEAVAFGPLDLGADRLLVASDGLFNFVSRDRILDLVRIGSAAVGADQLLDAARMRDGRLHDDVTVVVVG